jgi:hypothetical protein
MKLAFVHYAYVQYLNIRALCDIAERAVKKRRAYMQDSAGIFNIWCGGYMHRVGIGLSYRHARLSQPGGIGSLESTLGLLKSLKIRAQDSAMGVR